MLRIAAHDWDEIWREIRRLAPMEDYVADVKIYANRTSAVMEGDVEQKEEIAEILERIAAHCRAIGLELSAVYATRSARNVREAPSLYEQVLSKSPKAKRKPLFDFRVMGETLKERIHDELEGCVVLALDKRDAELFGDAKRVLNPETLMKFSSIRFDASEAGKCFATERYTACVFHLMRIMEAGLRSLSDSLNDPTLNPKSNPTWERLLGRCDEELKKPYTQRSSEWRNDGEFFSTATANLRAVKDAWRNSTLHVETNHNRDSADEIWKAVRAFMRHLATKLSG